MITPYPAPDDEPGNGVEVAAVRLVSVLAARGEDVVVVTDGDAAREEEREGIRVLRVEFEDARTLARRYRPWRTAAGRVLDHLDADVVHGQGLLFGALPACDHPRRPRLATAHGSPAWDALGAGPGLSHRTRGVAAAALAATTIRRLDAVISVHPDLRLHTRVRPRRFAYIPNIVAPPPSELPAREPRRVLYCGGTRWLKGFDRLRDAWPIVREIVPDARLHVVGWPAGVAARALGGGRRRVRRSAHAGRGGARDGTCRRDRRALAHGGRARRHLRCMVGRDTRDRVDRRRHPGHGAWRRAARRRRLARGAGGLHRALPARPGTDPTARRRGQPARRDDVRGAGRRCARRPLRVAPARRAVTAYVGPQSDGRLAPASSRGPRTAPSTTTNTILFAATAARRTRRAS